MTPSQTSTQSPADLSQNIVRPVRPSLVPFFAPRHVAVIGVPADILPENSEMQRLCKSLGFTIDRNLEEGTVEAWLDL